jgi:FAD/FMN-containing dehydrogenase
MSGVEVARLNGGSVSLSDETLDALAVDFHGHVVRPDEAGYDDARLIWNGMFKKRPGLVLRCLGAAGVRTAVRFAREHDLLVVVRGGGHSMAGRSVIDDGLLIDLSLMRAVRVDPTNNHVHAQGGARLADLDQEAQAYGLGVPSGVVGTTGVAGLTLGGGTGWQMRKLGLTIDNLVSVEIVTADGEVRSASATEHEELFWAVRGGGGNFGIVTSFEYQGHPLGPEVLVCAPWYPARMGQTVLRAWREFMADAPNEYGGQYVAWAIPATPLFPAEVHNEPAAVPFLVYTGDDLDGAERAIQPLRELGQPLADKTARMPWTRLQTQYDAAVPAQELSYYFKSLYIDRYDEEFIAFLEEACAEFPTVQSHALLIPFGGKMAEPGPEDTAFGRRDMQFVLEFDSIWREADDEERCITWVREVAKEAERFSNGGGYLNVHALGDDEDALVRDSLGAANYERLATIKHRYDPHNVFRINPSNVVPTAPVSAV